MKIAIANDHHGVALKSRIIDYLKNRNIEYINLGCDEVNNVDYVDYAEMLCKKINDKEADLGILVCGTGIGKSIAANKIHGIMAGKVNTPREAHLIREHNKANVMTLAEYTENLEDILDEFINTKPSEEERYQRRVDKIINLK